jgi:hypothetical protein
MHVLQDSFHIDLSAGLMLVYIYNRFFFFIFQLNTGRHYSGKEGHTSALLIRMMLMLYLVRNPCLPPCYITRRSYISSVDQNDVNVIKI